MRLWIILALLLGTVTSPTQSLESYRSGTLVMGKVIDLSGEDTNRKSATMEITAIYGANEAGIGIGDRLFTATQNMDYIGSSFPVVVPLLKRGEVGIWFAYKGRDGKCSPTHSPAYGRMWPAIEGRDSEYAEVKKWAEELDLKPERQTDYEGKQWPAPKPPPPLPRAIPPPLKTTTTVPAVSTPPPAASDSTPAPWPWYLLGGLGVLGVLGLLIRAGMPRKRQI